MWSVLSCDLSAYIATTTALCPSPPAPPLSRQRALQLYYLHCTNTTNANSNTDTTAYVQLYELFSCYLDIAAVPNERYIFKIFADCIPSQTELRRRFAKKRKLFLHNHKKTNRNPSAFQISETFWEFWKPKT